MPINEDPGEPDYARATPERTREFLYNESGLEADEADAYVENNSEQAREELDKAKNSKPKMEKGNTLTQFLSEKAAWQQQMDEAQRNVDYSEGVKNAGQETASGMAPAQDATNGAAPVDAGEQRASLRRKKQGVDARNDMDDFSGDSPTDSDNFSLSLHNEQEQSARESGINNNLSNNNEQRRNNLLGEDRVSSRQWEQESTGNAASGERVEEEERKTDDSGRNGAGSKESSVHQPKSERKGFEQNLYGGRKRDSTGISDDSTREVLEDRNRGDLRVYEEGLDTSYRAYSNDSERTRRSRESERLVNVSKQNGLYIPVEETKDLEGKVEKHTGESVVYINRETGKVTKVKEAYAKYAMKSGVQPEDAVFEHLVHNLLFSEIEYTFEGISEENGNVRIVLSQPLIKNYGKPTKKQIAEALAARGLFPEDNYSFGNEFVSVTDVEGDNVLLGEDGTVYFIDPIVRFKKPLRDILSALGSVGHQSPVKGEQVQVAGERRASLRKQKAGSSASEATEAERALRDALNDVLTAAGIEVVTDVEEGQRVMDEANGDAKLMAKKEHLKPRPFHMMWKINQQSFQVLTVQMY